ncbi:MAG TPA: S1 RNA-binding domain-containing protein [Armatimonadota bacterium]|jgi:ribosomal protein S1
MDDNEKNDDLYEAEDSEVPGEELGEDEMDLEPMDWADLDAAAPKAVDRGELVDATVVEIQDQAVVLDLGTKYEGFVPRSEFTTDEELPAVGDVIQVAVVNVDEKNERIRASKRRADYERAWGELYKAHEAGETVMGMVTERVRGGLRINVGLPGFVPASQVVVRDVRHLDRFVGRTLPLKIMEIDRRGNKVILSHKAALEEERVARRDKTMARLYEGAVCEGRVVSLTNYGAFIDLGGVDGLLHVSELAWHHVNHPSEVLKKNDIVRVVVLAIENEGERISLSRREILPDPWKELAGRFTEGQIVPVEITRLVSTGAFARPLDVDLEGFVPLREISDQRIKRPDEAIKVGQKLDARVIDLQPQAHKMTLSLATAVAQRRRDEVKTYQASADTGSGINLGEQFGSILRDAKAAIEGRPAEAEEPEAAAAPAVEEAAVAEDLAVEPEAQVEVAAAVEVPEEAAVEPEVELLAAEEQAEELAELECAAPVAEEAAEVVEAEEEPVAEAPAADEKPAEKK